MEKKTKRIAAGVGAALAVAGGGAALAATQLSPGGESEAVIADAAEQLGVTPAALSEALKQALENRIDEALADGRLTEDQAERLKERLERDAFPLFPVRRLPLPDGDRVPPHLRHFGLDGLEAAAAYLGLSEAELRERLAEGDTLAEIAGDRGKSVNGLVDALLAEHEERLNDAVEDGRLTDAHRDAMLAGLRERLTARVNGELPSLPGLRRHHEFGGFDFERPRPNDAGWRVDDVPPAA